MAEIELADVSKRFGQLVVIEKLSLSVRANEFMVFLGPSGCGKSTLLRMIAGLEAIDDGEIRIGGRRVDTLPPGERGVAMVFQHYALYPHMTVRENMAFGLRNVGMARTEISRRVEDAAQMLEIGQLLDRKPGQLSGGQRQRVAIGRAIIKDPKVFLFDEPLSNLDAALRVRTRVELAQLHQRVSSTMIFVTHDQVEAMTLADRIAVMNERRIEQIGTPMDIYARPASRFVAGFVGSPTMNFTSATLSETADGYARAEIPGGAAVETGIRRAEIPGRGDFELGIRAEAVRIAAPEKGDALGNAEVVERLGDRTLIYVRLADDLTVVAEDSGTSGVTVGDSVGLKFDGAAAHLFDETGKAYHAAERRES